MTDEARDDPRGGDSSEEDSRGGDSPFRPPVEVAAPRLGIRHLLLYTACCAAYMGLHRAFFLEDDGSEDEVRSAVFVVLYSFSSGAALAACALSVPWNLAGVRFPKEPGEWMLVLGGASLVVFLPLRAFVHGLIAEQRYDEYMFWIVGSLAATCWLYLLPLCLARVSKRWKAVFALFLARDVLVALAYAVLLMRLTSWAMGIDVVRVAFTSVVLAIVAVADLRDAKRYRWTHWTGVLCSLFSSLVSAARLIAFYIARPG